MFTMVSGALTTGISRFITYELGRENFEQLNRVFSTALFVQCTIAFLIIIILETFGIWFLNCRMNIQPERLYAANWVFQCSVITFVINFLSIPYNAAIIAHERMSAFAYITIFDSVVKLGIAYLITCISNYRLIVYAVLLMLCAVTIRLLYSVYCTRHFEECRVRPSFNKTLFKDIASFSGWNMIGSAAWMLRDQGVNVLLNLFFGTVVNASRGIASQVSTAVSGFAQNFMTAVNPQITKLYAINDLVATFSLAFNAAKFSFYILLIPALPILFYTTDILSFWLNNVPEYAPLFTQLAIIMALTEVISRPLITIVYATGKLKVYQLVVSGTMMLDFPLSYYLFKIGETPEYAYYVSIVNILLCLIWRLIILKSQTGLNISLFMRNVFLRVLLVSISSACLGYEIKSLFGVTISQIVMSILLMTIITTIISLFVGLSCKERLLLFRKVKQIVFNMINMHRLK